MNKNDKYRFVFESAKKFLNEMIDEHKLSRSILEGHMQHKQKFDDLSNANLQLMKSLANTGYMYRVISFDKKEKEINPLLFEYNPRKILAIYKDAEELLEKFNKSNLFSQTSIKSWRKFSRGLISGSICLASFKDKADFDGFIKTFAHNKYTKAALPMLLEKEIFGFGFPLACDFLKELGYRDYPKPDVHLRKIFYGCGLAVSEDKYEVYKTMIEMTEAVGEDAYTVDKIFWLIGSGNLAGDTSVGRGYRGRFIENIRESLLKIDH